MFKILQSSIWRLYSFMTLFKYAMVSCSSGQQVEARPKTAKCFRKLVPHLEKKNFLKKSTSGLLTLNQLLWTNFTATVTLKLLNGKTAAWPSWWMMQVKMSPPKNIGFILMGLLTLFGSKTWTLCLMTTKNCVLTRAKLSSSHQEWLWCSKSRTSQ